MFGAEVLPKHLRPLDVVIAVKIAAADRLSGKLQPPENHADGDRAGDEISSAHGCIRFNEICQRAFRFDLNVVRRFLKLFHVVIEKNDGSGRTNQIVSRSKGFKSVPSPIATRALIALGREMTFQWTSMRLRLRGSGNWVWKII